MVKKWMLENCDVVPATDAANAEFEGVLQNERNAPYFGLRLASYVGNPPGMTSHVRVECSLSEKSNIDCAYLVLREFKEGGKLSYQVERPFQGGVADLYLTSREPDMTLQAAILLRAASRGAAKAKLRIANFRIEAV